MGWTCICRQVRDNEVDMVMEDLDPSKKVTDEDISDHFDSGYVCGSCREVFEEKAQQHNKRLEERTRALTQPRKLSVTVNSDPKIR